MATLGGGASPEGGVSDLVMLGMAMAYLETEIGQH